MARIATPMTAPAAIPPFTPADRPSFDEALADAVGIIVEVSVGEKVADAEVSVVKPDALAEAVGEAVGFDPTLLNVQCIPGESRAARVGFKVSSSISKYMSGPVNWLLILTVPSSWRFGRQC